MVVIGADEPSEVGAAARLRPRTAREDAAQAAEPSAGARAVMPGQRVQGQRRVRLASQRRKAQGKRGSRAPNGRARALPPRRREQEGAQRQGKRREQEEKESKEVHQKERMFVRRHAPSHRSQQA